MPTLIKLSDKTMTLVSQLHLAQSNSDIELLPFVSSETDIKTLIDWLAEENTSNTNIFIRESLRASLLTDIVNSLPGTLYNHKKEDNNSKYKKALYIILAIAGTLFLGCEGFDGITSVLGIFSLSQGIVLAIGAAFSILSIAVFYGFDLLEISNNLGVSFNESRNVLDVCLQQLEQITLIEKKLSILNVDGKLKSKKELEESLMIIAALRAQLDSLEETRKKFEDSLNNKGLRAAKMGIALITGVMFFAGGFFAGHAVAITLASAIVGSAVAATAWPVVLAALVIASAAFMIYWFVERPGVQNLIGRLLGLDKEKVEKFSDEKGIASVQDALNATEKNIKAILKEQNTTITPAKLTAFFTKVKEKQVIVDQSPKVKTTPEIQLPARAGGKITRSSSETNLGFFVPPHTTVTKVANYASMGVK